MRPPVLRVARACRDVQVVGGQYVRALGFQVLSEWRDHAGFDGIILGQPHGPYHLEFIHDRKGEPPPVPHEEQLLVFYVDEHDDWSRRCEMMLAAGFTVVRNGNPFWETHGRTFTDAEGGRVVLHRGAWHR